MQRRGFAPGKIILSGEYAVLFGYKGIAVPAPLETSVAWLERDTGSMSVEARHGSPLQDTYIHRVLEECEKAANQRFAGTLRIESDVPVGKGMGSSTALVVAMAQCFGLDRQQALKVEDAVNPGHSGLDFEVIWENRPIVFQKGAQPKILHSPFSILHSALLDSGTPNETTPGLVAWMKEKACHPELVEGRHTLDALAAIGQCTERLLSGESLSTVIPDHHRAQIALGVVPATAQSMIKKIEQLSGVAKVIGAGGRTGGGGMVLAMGVSQENLAEAFSHSTH